MSDTILNVKVIKLGNPVKEITLAPGATVADALEAAGYSNATAKKNGIVVGPDTAVVNGDQLLLSDKVVGGK